MNALLGQTSEAHGNNMDEEDLKERSMENFKEGERSFVEHVSLLTEMSGSDESMAVDENKICGRSFKETILGSRNQSVDDSYWSNEEEGGVMVEGKKEEGEDIDIE